MDLTKWFRGEKQVTTQDVIGSGQLVSDSVKEILEQYEDIPDHILDKMATTIEKSAALITKHIK
jgi:hypothetical protein